MKKTYIIRKFRTNASGIDFETLHTGTLDDLNKYFGEQAKTIASLISRVNKDYAARYASCYRLHCHIERVRALPAPQRWAEHQMPIDPSHIAIIK